MKLNEQVRKRLAKLAGLPQKKQYMECHPDSGCWNYRAGHVEFGSVCVPASDSDSTVGSTPMFTSLHECVSSGCSVGNNSPDQSFP